MSNESIPEKEPFKEESVESRKCVNSNSEELPSIITTFFDQFNFKGLIKSIFQKTPLKATDQFIDAVLLFIFLLYLFYSLDVLRFELSWYMGLLFAIGGGAFLEFMVANTPHLRKLFSTDVRTKKFLDKVSLMTKKEIKEGTQNIFFSSKCMNLFLESIPEKHDQYPSYFVDLIIDSQVLRKENLNVLFSPNVIKYIRPEIIIKICAEYIDSLTDENIQNAYIQYKNNENVTKAIFATQNDSYFLIQNSDEEKEEKNQLNEFYRNYQIDKKHLDKVLKIIPMSNFRTIRNKLFWFSFVVSFVLFIISLEYGSIRTPIPFEDFIVYLIGLLIFPALIIVFIVDPIIRKVQDFYHKRLINNIIKL